MADSYFQFGGSVRTRSVLTLGAPLEGYIDESDKMEEQRDVYIKGFWTHLEKEFFDFFGMKRMLSDRVPFGA